MKRKGTCSETKTKRNKCLYTGQFLKPFIGHVSATCLDIFPYKQNGGNT